MNYAAYYVTNRKIWSVCRPQAISTVLSKKSPRDDVNINTA